MVICTVAELPGCPLGRISTVSFFGGFAAPPAVPINRKKCPCTCIGWYSGIIIMPLFTIDI